MKVLAGFLNGFDFLNMKPDNSVIRGELPGLSARALVEPGKQYAAYLRPAIGKPFSARWTGSLIAPDAGEYEIAVEYDDGARLFLNGKLVAEDWKLGPKRLSSAKITLTKGQALPIKVEYYQGKLDRYFRLSWRTPSDLRALATKSQTNNAVDTYLPQGADWYDFWTNERLAGGRSVSKNCPIDVMPLYVRAGSIVPMGPVVQYATEHPDAPYEVRVYPGADATFTLYEDDNETYNYEKGDFATYDLVWNDSAKTLTIGPRKGTFPGMVAKRKLDMVVAASGQPGGEKKSVVFNGEPVTVSFSK